MVEIQVIQRINLELKKLEHKLYDFIREYEEFIRNSEENKKLLESFRKAMTTLDVKAADHLSNSSRSSLQTVRQILLDY